MGEQRASLDAYVMHPIAWTVRLKRSALLLAGVVLLATLAFRWYFGLTVISGESMLPTLGPGDLLVFERRAYSDSAPMRGDIVIARYRNEFIVKRIVGLPGEELEMKDGVLFVNGVAVPEEWGRSRSTIDIAPGRLADDKYATLGDNRGTPSTESVHPIIARTQIVGRVAFPIRFGRR
jgi:signal peptidase I